VLEYLPTINAIKTLDPQMIFPPQRIEIMAAKMTKIVNKAKDLYCTVFGTVLYSSISAIKVKETQPEHTVSPFKAYDPHHKFKTVGVNYGEQNTVS